MGRIELICLCVCSFILKEPKILQQAPLMFIIILMKSKSSQKRREQRGDGKSKRSNNLYPVLLFHPSFHPSSPSHVIQPSRRSELNNTRRTKVFLLISRQPLWKTVTPAPRLSSLTSLSEHHMDVQLCIHMMQHTLARCLLF